MLLLTRKRDLDAEKEGLQERTGKIKITTREQDVTLLGRIREISSVVTINIGNTQSLE